MAFLGQPERVFYEAKNFRSGLANITVNIKRPDGNTNTAPMNELPAPFLGVYFYDLMTSMTDPIGEYLFLVNSPTENRKDITIRFFEPAQSGGGTATSSIFTTEVQGSVKEIVEIQGQLQENPLIQVMLLPTQKLAALLLPPTPLTAKILTANLQGIVSLQQFVQGTAFQC